MKLWTLKVSMFTLTFFAIDAFVLVYDIFWSITQEAVIFVIFWEISESTLKVIKCELMNYRIVDWFNLKVIPNHGNKIKTDEER